MVCLDERGEVVRPALLWNDTRSAQAAADLVAELGAQEWADAVGSVPVASFTVTKLRWLAQHEPENAAATAAVCLPHDWLTWRLRSGLGSAPGLADLVTDRCDASGTGYFSGVTGRVPPRPAGAGLRPGRRGAAAGARRRRGGRAAPRPGRCSGPGAGDNAARRAGARRRAGRRGGLDRHLRGGLRGERGAHRGPDRDVAGFASATGEHLPLVCTLNAARVLDARPPCSGVDHDRLAELALSAPAGAGGLVLVPYLEGERTPNRPDATGALHGADARDREPRPPGPGRGRGAAVRAGRRARRARGAGVPVRRVFLVGGGARSEAVQAIAPAVLGRPVVVPAPGEYVADGAARQAAWVLAGAAEPPVWEPAGTVVREADPTPAVRARYAEVRDLTAARV